MVNLLSLHLISVTTCVLDCECFLQGDEGTAGVQASSSCAVHWQGIWDSQIWRPLLPHHGVHVRGSSCYEYLSRTQTLPSVWNDLVTGPIIVDCMCPFLVTANGVRRIFLTKRLHNIKWYWLVAILQSDSLTQSATVKSAQPRYIIAQ